MCRLHVLVCEVVCKPHSTLYMELMDTWILESIPYRCQESHYTYIYKIIFYVINIYNFS